MLNLNLMSEAAALAGYTIGSTGQDATNKTRAQRRVNLIKADIISRYGGHWPSNYREGWLALVPLYTTGTALFTNASRNVSGSGTTWTQSFKGMKIKGPDGAYYKIASVVDGTNLILTQPFQGTTASGASYQIWQDEYPLFPEALSIGGFLDYELQGIASEAWPRNMKDSFPVPTSSDLPSVFTTIGRKSLSATYSTGTISGTINTNILTGVGTAWLANLQPGYEIIVGTYTYHVRAVNSDTEIEIYQLLVVTVAALTSYVSRGKNALIIRFKGPTTQRIVHYWYWAKDYPFANDSDEDWIAEMFPRVIVDGMTYYDYLDKNDVPRAFNSRQIFENSIKDMKVAVDNAYTGVRTLGYDIPPAARD